MGKRNSQLQELTVVAQNDYLTIVDTSAGQSKRVSVKTLVGNVDLGWVATGESWTFSSWSSTTRVGVITVPSDATTKYTPGMRTRFSQTTGGTKYGIILAVTTTTLTVFFPSGTTFTNETITSPVYSSIKVPYGFDADEAVWTLRYSTSTGVIRNNPTASTWYAVTGASLVVPVGSWRMKYSTSYAATRAAASAVRAKTTLATASASETDADMTTYIGATSNEIYISDITRSKAYKHAVQTTYYLNFQVTVSSITDLQTLGSQSNTTIEAACTYL